MIERATAACAAGVASGGLAGGGSVIYISHRLEEIFAIADRVTVLRDGQLVGTLDIAASGIDQNGLGSLPRLPLVPEAVAVSEPVGPYLEVAHPRAHLPW